MKSNTPNILILMADQLRQDALGCYGNPLVRTPNLDRLSESGTRFDRAFCPTPICVASRMSLITGCRAARHHWVDNGALPGPVPELPTIMTLLHHAGYHTQGIGKMHFSGRMYGFQSLLRMEECVSYRIDDDYLLYLKERGIHTRYPQGIRDLLYYQPQTSGIPEAFSQNRWVADRSVEFLRQHTRNRNGKPFFLWSSWIAPHPPFAPCEPYDSMYDPESFPLPVYPERPISSIPESARGHRARLCGAHLDPARIRRIRALYAGQVSHVDDCVGFVLNELKNLGLDNNTIVLFLSDHGDMLGDHGLSQKNVPYGPSVTIPMLLRWPGKTDTGKSCPELVGIEDVLPTLIEELNLEYDDYSSPLPGVNLFHSIRQNPQWTRYRYFIDYGSGRSRWVSVREKDYVYSYWASGGVKELYHLTDDPMETQNRINEFPDIAEELHDRLIGWEKSYGLGDPTAQNVFPKYSESKHPENNWTQGVTINDGRWPENLPEDETDTVETYGEAFSRAIRKEISLKPSQLPLSEYKQKKGNSLENTPWENEWRDA